jgi:excinuclease ABC subunit B
MINKPFKLVSDFEPKGDQPKAIAKILEGLEQGFSPQTFLGVTGSGKTFSIANVIAKMNKPALILAHNKTLAAQLYEELKSYFPNNRVEYFVSYYDYYQPESYIPSSDKYIEKDAAINPKIEQMRLSATSSLMSRSDTIIVASVSCIYGLGSPQNYEHAGFDIEVGKKITRKKLIYSLVRSLYERNDAVISSGKFRVKGDIIDFIPGGYGKIIRIELFGEDVERILEIDPNTNEVLDNFKYFHVFPAKHFVVDDSKLDFAIESIKKELKNILPQLEPLEAHRLKQRTLYDLDMIKETGYCKGIENYSRHLENREPGSRPFTLLDYFPKDFIMIIDESHQTIPQLHGMYQGDYSRKKNLVDFGFRLPSAFDNRPLKFEEFEKIIKEKKVIFVSATPGPYEMLNSKWFVEQIIRPTGLVDPNVEVRPSKTQVFDVKKEIGKAIKKGNRVLLTTLTKKLAEELTEYLSQKGIKTRYLHSEIDTLERTEILRELRLGVFDCLVGINLLREGLDIPEVGFVGILDADHQGFLRNSTSLIQTIGRAARNLDSVVVLYADEITDSIKQAIEETKRRRKIQLNYNKKNKIIPKTVVKPIRDKQVEIKDTKHIPKSEIPNMIIELNAQMEKAAENLDFETAIFLREKIKKLQERIG